MRAAQVVQLEQVLGLAQEAVGGGQVVGVLAADIAAPRERRQGGQGTRGAHPLVGAAVDELQQLDGELNVAKPAGAELQLAAGHVLGQRGLDPAAHRLDVLDEVLALGGLPDQRGHRGRVRLRQGHVASHRAGLEQRLELPGLRPPVVVGEVAAQGADERPVAALRAQVRVDGEDCPLGGEPLAHPDHAGGQLGRDLHARRVGVVTDDEDHVDVAGVVQLAGTALAHRDHRELRHRDIGGQLGAGDGQRSLQHCPGDVGEFLGHLVDGAVPGEVPCRQVQQPAVVGGGERARGAGVIGARQARPRLGHVRVGTDGAQQLGADRRGLRALAPRRAGEHRAVTRMAGQVVGECRARPQGRDEPVPQAGVPPDLRDDRAVALGDPGEAGQREVGIGGGSERGEQALVLRGTTRDGSLRDAELRERPLGARHIRQAHAGQPASQGGTNAAHGINRIPATRHTAKPVSNVPEIQAVPAERRTIRRSPIDWWGENHAPTAGGPARRSERQRAELRVVRRAVEGREERAPLHAQPGPGDPASRAGPP